MKNNPTVMLLIDRSRKANRALLQGLFKYIEQNEPWNFLGLPASYLERTSFSEVLNKYRNTIDGLFTYFPYTYSTETYLHNNIPTIGIPLREFIPGVINISSNWQETGEMAAEYFLGLGYRRFAFCGCDMILWSRERSQSFSHVIHKAGYDVHVYKYPKSDRIIHLKQEMPYLIKWLKSLPKPIALLAWNDERCEDITKACQIADIKIPEQIAVLGIDNDEYICNLTNVPLSSIELNFEETGFAAACALDHLIKGKDPYQWNIPVQPLRVVSRKSTNMMAYSDPDIINSLNYIKKNAVRPIQVGEVVERTCLSKRTLQIKFKTFVGRTIQEEIILSRINAAARMLLETDMTVIQIANKLGYSDVTDFCRRFKKVNSMTPSTYRKTNRQRG